MFCLHLCMSMYSVHACMSMYSLHACTVAAKVRRASNLLELELQRVVSPVWELGIELGSNGKAVSVFTVEPSLQSWIFVFCGEGWSPGCPATELQPYPYSYCIWPCSPGYGLELTAILLPLSPGLSEDRPENGHSDAKIWKQTFCFETEIAMQP